jgi:hypothetical protein
MSTLQDSWGLGVGLMTPHWKKLFVTKSEEAESF